ncbi:MAG: hypothetical protein M3R43_10000, partial [Acidobacteriota bacterium]|nr:hypothetical protein [Acidobacteriota bacterium]
MTTARDPRRALTLFIVLAALSTIFLDYWEYSRSFHKDPGIWASTLRGTTEAPAQYRIGVLKAAEFLTLHSSLAMRHALTLIDFAALLIAAFVLRALLTRSATWRSASLAAKWFGAAAFVLLLEYSLAWLTWYQRPETLTIAALLALSLWLSTHRLPVGKLAGTPLTALCLVVLGFLQGFTRADVGVTFHFGVALICLTRLGKGFALPRWIQFAASLLAAAAAGGTQLYIMRVLYPHASYGLTPRFQLPLNYTDHIRVVPFALFIVPSVWVAVQIVRRSFRPGPAQAGLLIAAAIFVCLWCVLGKIDEVRIFLPFAFALAPLTVEAALARVAAVEG